MAYKNTIIKSLFLLAYCFDQYPRKLLDNTKSKPFRLIIWYVIKIFDVLNQFLIYLIPIHKKWPDEHVYGTLVNRAAFYIIMHGNKRIIEKNIRSLHNSVCKNQSPQMHLAMMIDRLLMYRQKKQIYGTQIRGIKLNDLGNTYFIYPIVNSKVVNKRREKMGIKDPIEKYAKENNAILLYDEVISEKLLEFPSN